MFITANGLRLFCRIEGQGPPLVLLHGNGESHDIFDAAIERLKGRFTLYALDSRGHGQSQTAPLHYADMAADVVAVIEALGLERPALYGFSDGGIVGLLVAIAQPALLSALVVSGVNANPGGVKALWRILMRLEYWRSRSPLLWLMLTEPDITDRQLAGIDLSVVLTAGSRDMIPARHTRHIAAQIPNSRLCILPGEDHASYIVHSAKIAELLLRLL